MSSRSRLSLTTLAVGVSLSTVAGVMMRHLLRRASSLSLTAAVMPRLPSTVQKYSQVPAKGSFTAKKIPKGLLKQHNTKAGTWGVIRIQQGRLRYQINEPQPAIFELDEENSGIIEPQVLHEVAPLTDDLLFVVEFYREAGTGPVKETREA
mmetsp:Transcript_33616/g.60850  ORF Transcript_33616/g.60850 Transcript_33616/m.60850 type:complete len:151 (+) Transcript_33616:97-549(+)